MMKTALETRYGPRIHLISLGCAKNLVDSERLLARLGSAGAVVGAPAEEADIAIVNTCGFIRPAKEESLDAILEMGQWKRQRAGRSLFVMGCLAQRYASELRRRLPEVDGVFGLDEQEALVRACVPYAAAPPATGAPPRLLLTPRHTAYLRIAEGCDNRCAYCTIPLIRGPFRSRPMEEVVAEAEQLVAHGVRELNLIGQDTTRYGSDLPGAPRIEDLLARLSALRRLRWLRLLYTHPAHFSEGLIEAYATLPKLCPYVDLPLQHLDDDILRRMGRRVSRAQCLRLIERLRERVPGVAIRTALIVGFPGETRAQFNDLLRLVRVIAFDHLGAFAYSREEGTRAARMAGQVSERTKARRLRELMAAQQEVVAEKNRSRIGTRHEVLIEGPAPGREGMWLARARTQAPEVDSVTWLLDEPSARLRPGRLVHAVVTGAHGYDWTARPA